MPRSPRTRAPAAARTRPLDVGIKAGSRTIFTGGYSGHTPSSFVALVRAAGVEQVLDVRSFPFSRKPGFSKNALDAFLKSRGLAYVHLPALGAPRALLIKRRGGATMAEIAPGYQFA